MLFAKGSCRLSKETHTLWSRHTLHWMVLSTHTHSLTHIRWAVARQPRPSDMLLTEIISTVLWLPFSPPHVTEFTLGSDRGPDGAPPGPRRGRERLSDPDSEGRKKKKKKSMSKSGRKRMSSEMGEGLIKGNICKPEKSYVNGSVIKAF